MLGKSSPWWIGAGLLLIPTFADARATRPDPLKDETGCDHYLGVPIGANDPTQQFELIVCTTAEGVRAKVQTSSLESGWSVRQSVGAWDAAGRVLTLRETEFLEQRPEPGWRFCLIDEMVLEKTDDEGLTGHYVSEPCSDRAKLRLTRLEPVAPAGGVAVVDSAPTPSPPPPLPPKSEPNTSEPSASEPARGCACAVSSGPRLPTGALLLGLGLLVAAARRLRRHASFILALFLLGGCVPECGGLNPNCEAKCSETGECGRRTYKAGDAFARCYVRSSEDCANARVCKRSGACHLYDGIDPGKCVALTDLDCRQSSNCAEYGACSLGDRGRCEVEPSGCQRSQGCRDDDKCIYGPGGGCSPGKIDCTQACPIEGACTVRDGVCVATSSDDCRRSSNCARSGQCTLAGDRCVAASAADCEGSSMCELNGWCFAVDGGDGCYDGRTECGQLCWERGDCKRIDGTCQPEDDCACADSLACIVMGQCSVTGRPAVMCGADKSADCESSLECKAFGRCTAKDIHCVDQSGRTPSSSVGCLRDPECANQGRCLTDASGRCVTAAEAGLPDWKPPPPLR